MKRLVPLVVLLAVLVGGSAAAVFALTGDGDGPTSADSIARDECSLVHNIDACDAEDSGSQMPIRSDEGIDPGECNLVHNVDACEEDAAGDTAGSLGMCVEGAEECVDMIVVGDGQEPITIIDDMDPNECSLVHNIDACDGLGPVTPGDATTGGGSYEVSVEFKASATQDDITAAGELIRSYDPDADMLVMERFPPAGRARVDSDAVDFCATVEFELETIAGVDDASCRAVAEEPIAIDPDQPVVSP